MSSRLRQLVARAVSALPSQCDADATAWAAGVSMRRLPWFPQSPGCRVDSLHEGECMCGRLGPGMDAQAALHAADEGCSNCPDGYDCSTGDYYTGDVQLVADVEAAHTEALYEAVYRDWPELNDKPTQEPTP
jgi:hypothetical protein